LHAIGRLDLMQVLFDSVFVAPAVATEIQRFALPQWIQVSEPGVGAMEMTLPGVLGAGETETILLSLRMCPDITIPDESAARAVARTLGINITGVLGLLLAGKKLGLLASVRADVDALRAFGFHIAPKLYRDVIDLASEQ
jgi:hypothetical protein